MKDSAPEPPPNEPPPNEPAPLRRKWRRWLAFLAVLFPLAPLFLALVILGGLEIEGVRRALLTELSGRLEAAAGVKLEAADFTLGVRAGELVVDDLRLSAVGDPFLQIERLRAEFHWREILGAPRVLRRLEIERPVFDSRQPLPAADDEPLDLPLRIREILLTHGRFLATPPVDETWLRAWSAEDLEVRGTLSDNSTTVELESGRLHLERAAGEPLELTARGRAAGPLAGPFEIDALKLDGEGLDLDGNAFFGLGPGASRRVDLELTADLARLLPELLAPPEEPAPAGGSLRASLELDLRTLTGHLEADATDFPLAALEPWTGRLIAAGESPAFVDLEARATGDRDAVPQVDAEAHLVLRRAGRTLATADLRLLEGRLDDRGVDIASLAGDIDVRADDVPAEILRPWLEKAAPGGDLFTRLAAAGTRLDLEARGRLDASGTSSGSAEIDWRRGREKWLAFNASHVEAETDGLEIAFGAALLPASPGQRRLDGHLAAASWPELGDGSLRDTWLRVELPEVGAAVDDFRERWPALMARLERDALPMDLDGSFEATAELVGALTDPAAEIAGVWDLSEETHLTLEARGRPAALRGTAKLRVEDFALDRFRALEKTLAGRLDATLELDASAFDGSWSSISAFLAADAAEMRHGDLPILDSLRLEARVRGEELVVSDLEARAEDARYRGSIQAEIRPLLAGEKLRRMSLSLTGSQPATGVDRFTLDAELKDGVVEIPRLTLEAPTGNGDLEAEIPLGALAILLDLDQGFDEMLPITAEEGPILVDLGFPNLDLAPLIEDFNLEAPWQSHRLGLTGRLVIDPARPTAAVGEFLVEDWLLEIEDHRLETLPDEALLFDLGNGRLDLLPVTIHLDGDPLDVEGGVDLAADWHPGDEITALLATYDLTARGTIATALSNPFLEGGRAEGPAQIDLVVSGDGSTTSITGELDGPDVTLTYRDPYLTRLAAPRLEFTYDAGEIDFRTTHLRFNEGQAELEGYRADNGDWYFRAVVDDVRYRVDYGLSVVLDGDLAFDLPAEQRGLMIGDVSVESGVLRRDLNLDREVMGSLFGGTPAMAGARVDWRENVDLDFALTTVEGVRIRNNLADLRATWDRLDVGGDLARPAIRGSVDLEPGGELSIYGQVARIDQGTVRFTGLPGAAPEIEVTTTSSLDDPSLRQLTGGQLAGDLSAGRGTSTDDRSTQDHLAQGLASYVGGQVFEQLGLSGVSIRPVLIFGETDPSTSLVVSRNFLPQVGFAVAIDLRDSQNQTYLLDLHNFRALPRVSFQVFSDSEQDEGITAQQQLFFGPGKREDADQRWPRLAKVSFTGGPEDVSRDALRRAVVFERGDPLPDGAAFDTEIDVGDLLRERGYPGAEVTVEIDELDKRRSEMRIDVIPGPRALFEFTGTPPPASLRRGITAPYRIDYFEEDSLEEVRQLAVRALRGQGYLNPRSEFSVERHPDGASRTVTIESEGGERIELETVVFEATAGEELPADVLAQLDERFPSQTARVELAAALTEADRWLLANLRTLGFPKAAIVDRRFSPEVRSLTLEISPGPRQTLARITVEGYPPGESEAEYLTLLPLAEGDSPRPDLVAAGQLGLRRHLEERGFPEAEVRTEIRPLSAETSAQALSAADASELELVYRLEPGPRYQLDAVRFAGLESTNEKWARRITALDSGGLLAPDELGTARRNLFRTGLFETVRTVTERDAETGRAAVAFELDEIPRYRLAYGFRWESEDGLALVLDGVDRNFLGRGVTLGLRALYSEDIKAGRFYLARQGIGKRRLGLEYFLEVRDELDEGLEDDPFDDFPVESIDSTLRFSFPWKALTSRFYASWRRETITLPDPFLPGSLFEETLRIPVIGWQLFYDTRDDALAPTRGFFASTDLSASGDYLGSDFDFVRLFAQLSWVRPAFDIGGVPFTWAQGYRLGWLESQDDEPLITERFEAGGEFSVRGYPTDSLKDDFLGGLTLLVINQELRFPVWGRLGGVVFFDAGNAWVDPDDFASDFFTSTGFGVRADTPVGLIRLDVAFPLDRREDDSSSRFYFGFGHSF